MVVGILTPVRLLADGLTICLRSRAEVLDVMLARDLRELRDVCAGHCIDVAIIDVTQGVNVEEVRALAVEFPRTALLAFGLIEQRQEVIRCGRAGFAGYVTRDASVESLLDAVFDAIAGRLACPSEISAGLLRALFRTAPEPQHSPESDSLTRREGDVLHLLGQGLSNKEIARELNLSVATIKHHVHNILGKLHLQRRAQAMRQVRDVPWLAARPKSMQWQEG